MTVDPCPKSNTMVIVGAVVGVLALLCIIGGIYKCQQNKKSTGPQRQKVAGADGENLM